MSDEIHERIDVGVTAIAVRRQDGRAPAIMWLGGSLTENLSNMPAHI